ncbi:MAG: hypothetical protein QME87_02630 [Bacillota bacterium]|nr:hypothetical protein [Bacillota bacterium]
MNPAVLGCVGTAKNTGKTTALTAILGEARRHGYRPALTSIGYDGEELDNLTGLPKPRVDVEPGDLVASALPCLERAPAGWDMVADCGVATALGPLVLARVTSPGRVILAGPAHRRGLATLCRLLAARREADLVLVDGAFGRLSPLARAHGMVLSTGAARSRDLNALGREARAIAGLLSLPRERLRGLPGRRPRLLRPLGADEAEEAARLLATGRDVLVAGMVTLAGLAQVAHALRPPPGAPETRTPGGVAGGPGAPEAQGWGRLVFTDPVQLLLAGEPEQVSNVVCRIISRGVRLAVGSGPAILAVTANPCYPVPLGGGRFRAGAVDAGALRTSLEEHLGAGVPVVDVLRDGPDRLWRVVEERLLARGPRARGAAEPLPGTVRAGFPAQMRGTDPGGPCTG